MIVAYRAADRAVFLYGFAKNDRENIEEDELQTLRTIGAIWLAAAADKITQALGNGDLQEILDDDQEA
ncbi:RelE toxin of RelEB toxin-antitoxin system [Nitrospirillum viridazoti]|uniref:RelE toxin of RelEB toxin-antitoxin system n=2 Tax=Nitrospirillum TaxID=1543705 RepID=A0A560HQI4_9PROT|nr:RelE toxin of RelEB toxin-antitoxin system [Nitrospirillum amazonense]